MVFRPNQLPFLHRASHSNPHPKGHCPSRWSPPAKYGLPCPTGSAGKSASPPQTIALRQPDTLFIIYPRLKRIEKYRLTGAQPGQWRDVLALLDASFPKSRAVMEAQFRVLSITQTNADWQVVLQPKSALARSLMGEMDICVRTNDFSLSATEMKFADGSRMRNDFTNIILNPVLPEGCFDLNPAPDFTVVEPLRQ